MILNLTHLDIESDIKMQRIDFNPNESFIKIKGSVKNKKIKIISSIKTDKDFLLLMDICLDLIKKNVKKINIYFSYIYYSTQEKSDQKEINKFKNRLFILSSLRNVNFYFFDIHKKYSLNYIENSLPFKNINSSKIIKKISKAIDIDVLASPDEGNLKNVKKYAFNLNKSYAFCLKERTLNDVSNFLSYGNVKNKNILICDDMIRSGKTLLLAAQSFKNKGAKKIYVYASHNLLENDNLLKSNIIEKVYVSNSVKAEFNHKNLRVIDIKNIFNKG